MKYIKILSIALALAALMTSCAYPSGSNIHGGDMLDSELMSEIKSQVFSSAETEESQSTETDETEATTLVNTNQETESNITSATEQIDRTEDKSNTEAVSSKAETEESDTEDAVYWLEGGSVWHLSESCYHIKDAEKIYSGSVEEAKGNNKTKLCSNCEKKYK